MEQFILEDDITRTMYRPESIEAVVVRDLCDQLLVDDPGCGLPQDLHEPDEL